jgi:hypothetical protein
MDDLFMSVTTTNRASACLATAAPMMPTGPASSRSLRAGGLRL